MSRGHRVFLRLALAGLLLQPGAFFAAPGPDPDLVSPTFTALVSDRALIDRYHARHYRAEDSLHPVPGSDTASIPAIPGALRVVRPRIRDGTSRYRSLFTRSVPVIPGFRAAILDHATARPPHQIIPAALTPEQRTAARWVADHLDTQLLLPTAARVLEILGPAPFEQAGEAEISSLRQIGFPVDLLESFDPEPTTPPSVRITAVLRHLTLTLRAGPTPEMLAAELARIPFRFRPACPGFVVTPEDGESEIGMLRVQIGGGYRQGIVPGGNIDVVGQLVHALPQADFVASVPAEIFAPFQRLASDTWPLQRTAQATLVIEDFAISAWAQDNGKPGTVPVAAPAPPDLRGRRLATLCPRYASIGEDTDSFVPGESFLMDGLAATGHAVYQSSLKFQGGNLFAVTEPVSGKKLLLLGEGEVRRNRSLGLSESQILEAFRLEFGVDRCVVLPATSYHLDYDTSIRLHGDQLVAMVNDTQAAARIIVTLGIDALRKHQALPAQQAYILLSHLTARRDSDALLHLVQLYGDLLPPPSDPGSPSSPIAEQWVRCFAADPADSPAGNLQEFLLAVDLLEAGGPPAVPDPPNRTPERAAYIDALRRMEQARERQIRFLRSLGWTIAPIPSIPELNRGINYLNGIQHRNGYIMPAYGGFYRSLDQAAEAAIRQALGPALKITPILCAESQRFHGGIHCSTAVYPRLPGS